MKISMKSRMLGFTLIEMMLVAIIVSGIIILGVRYMQQKAEQWKMDKTVSDMQQILNGAAAFYVANGRWPGTSSSGISQNPIKCLQGDTTVDSACSIQYIAANITQNPSTPQTFSNASRAYNAYSGSNGSAPAFYVYTFFITHPKTTGPAYAYPIAGRLPNGQAGFVRLDTVKRGLYVSTPCTSTSNTNGVRGCHVLASIPIPSQNLATANAVNFAGLYHHGACVPVPTCPVDADGNTMTPQIMIVPVSVSGMNDPNSTNVYPINSFSAYASGPPASTPAACANGTASACTPISGNAPSSGTYWRACLQVITEKGDVAITNTGGFPSATYPTYPWGGNVTLMAITRCAVSNEPAGSAFTVFTQ